MDCKVNSMQADSSTNIEENVCQANSGKLNLEELHFRLEVSDDSDCLNNEDDQLNDSMVDKVNLEEQQHFLDILTTFRLYKTSMNRRIAQSRNFINQMSSKHRQKLASYQEHLEQLELRVSHNYEVIKVIIKDAADMFKNSVFMQDNQNILVVKSERQLDTNRINSVLNQIVREWTAQGFTERETCFKPILDALERHTAHIERRSEMKVLVPGAGLGRLPFEIANRGYSCQGNEFSLMMLFVSNFIINNSQEPNSFTFYPWVSHFCNNLTSAQQMTSLTFPDISLATIPDDVDFSMAAGSFTEVYANDHHKWDCVVTSFFLDTSANIVQTIETIEDILQPDGLWINFGPLLYHFADMPEPSVEPSYEIVREIIQSSGFVFIEEQTNLTSYYTRNPNSMLSYEYKSIFFVCRKK